MAGSGPNVVNVDVSDAVGVSDALASGSIASPNVSDTVSVSDALAFEGAGNLNVQDVVTITERLTLLQEPTHGTVVTVDFSDGFRVEGVVDLSNYRVEPASPAAYPITLLAAVPQTVLLQSGSSGRVVVDPGLTYTSTVFVSPTLGPVSVGQFIATFGPPSVVIDVAGSGRVTLGDAVEGAYGDFGHVEWTLYDTNGITVINDGVDGGFEPAQTPVTSNWLALDGSFLSDTIGQYLFLSSPANRQDYLRIVDVDPGTGSLKVDRPLFLNDPDNGSIPWTNTTPCGGVVLSMTKPTNGQTYNLFTTNLQAIDGSPATFSSSFQGISSLPQLVDTEDLGNGCLLITFSEPMRRDGAVTSPSEYSISGPTPVSVDSVVSISDTQVLLRTTGMSSGSYDLTVNASGTPHDYVGNPIDAGFNLGSFGASIPLDVRSIFVDKGPIAKPPLTLQAGTSASIASITDVSCPGAAFTSSAIGHYLTLSGGTKNGGTFLVTGVVSATRVRVQASFSLPDPSSGSLVWSLIDPRNGQIADNATDVVVRINGFPTQADDVIGLLGQIVMPEAPPHGADVQVDYSWVRNPVVEMRALNNTQFTLNGRRKSDPINQHNYAYKPVLMRPGNFVPPVTIQSGIGATVFSTTQFQLTGATLGSANVGMLLTIAAGTNAGTYVIAGVTGVSIVQIVGVIDPDATPRAWTVIDPKDDFQAALAPPLLRDIKYRAYERAYTATLNDPNLLLLNSPNQKIAFPPLSRTLASTFIRYDAVVLPELDPTNPWTRVGTGTATISSDQLIVSDTSGGPFPAGDPIFWTRPIDLTFDHVFAAAWRVFVNSDPVTQGVFTGVAAGYSDDLHVVVIGFLDDGGTRKIGVLKKGFGNDPSDISAWAGGIDGSGNPTGAPFVFDWSVVHSYRIFRDRSGTIRLYVDGEVIESLRVVETDLPFLEELEGPFEALQGVFFGSVSRPAQNTSTWSFMSYTVLPTNPVQTAPSSFVSYEGTTPPEESSPPWTPVGYHGTETIIGGSSLLLDSTSATTTATEEQVGLVGGDFRGYVKIEPLLIASSDVVLDIGPQLRTFTHGIAPNALMAAIDDGDRLIQLCFFPDKPSPKFSYGGRSFPEDSTPVAWSSMGTAAVEMVGRTLRITDSVIGNGRVYFVDDTTSPHVATNSASYVMEVRAEVRSYVVDGGGFAGVTAQTYDTARSVGIMLRDVAGTRYVTFHSDGVPVVGAQFAFEWFDGEPHTYRFVVVPGSNLVALFVDSVLLGTAPYTSFTIPAPVPNGVISWGSATPASAGALSVVDWIYANAWRVYDNPKRFAGIWKGTDADALTGYHLPLKASGVGALVIGNALGDGAADFIAAGVVVGDYLVCDDGPNKGVYLVASVSQMTLTVDVTTPFPAQPTRISYRIPSQIDWSTQHSYRLVRDPGGGVALFVDGVSAPVIKLGYNNIDLPSSFAGIVRTLSGGLPAIAFGAFDPTNLSQSSWDFVRYGIVRSPAELRIVPPHQILNQRNAISSPEHLTTNVPHPHTGFWSSSTGIPPQIAPDFLRNTSVAAYTRLNQSTPPMLLTQTMEVRRPVPVLQPIAGFNRPSDVLNGNGAFRLNDATAQVRLIVPNDVLYSSLQLIETAAGVPDVMAPFDDMAASLGTLSYQNEVCLVYDGTALPENTLSPTPWTIQSDNPSQVSSSAFAGILTYGTLGIGTRTAYRNMTPLPDSPGLQTQVTFRIKLLNDTTGGLGDSQVRFGFSAPGLTLGLGLVTLPSGERYVLVYDMNAMSIVGGVPFDFFDGAFHDYRLVRDTSADTVQLFIDS